VLLEESGHCLPQVLEGAGQVHRDRFRRDLEDRRHLGVTQLVLPSELKHLALAVRKGVDRPLQSRGPLQLLHLLFRTRWRPRSLLGRDRRRPALQEAVFHLQVLETIQRLVAGSGIEIGAEVLLQPDPPTLAPDLEEDVMYQILRFVR
jgi:hypothetical protein